MATDRLTTASIRSAFKTAAATAAPSKLSDGEGLSLIARPDGTGLWRFRYRWNGKQQTLSAGKWPAVSLAEARANRNKYREDLRQKQNPSTLKKKARNGSTNTAPTFEKVARDWHASRKNRWRPKHTSQVIRSLEANVFPKFGSKTFDEIDREDIRSALKRMLDEGANELAIRVCQRIRDVFVFAIDSGYTDRNPADAVRRTLPAPEKGRLPALPPSSLPELVTAIETYPGRPETVVALKLLLLTFVRPGELRAAEWTEFDVNESIWRIPEGRMKRNVAHLVPLSKQALALLEQLRKVTGHGRYLFPSVTTDKRPISDNTLNQALKRSGLDGRHCAHGNRSIASTWLNESGNFSPDVIERQLSHEPQDPVRAAYNRAEYLAQRREMMQAWADHVEATAERIEAAS